MQFDSGDTAWMLTATLLVMMMLLPGLALFCGGLVRAKNLLSVLSQVMGVGADVFGIYGLGGIVGSIGTAVVALPPLGGHGGEDYALGAQLVRQVGAVMLAIGWSAVGSTICFGLTRLAVPLRRDADEEREGLDLSDHGERAYNP